MCAMINNFESIMCDKKLRMVTFLEPLWETEIVRELGGIKFHWLVLYPFYRNTSFLVWIGLLITNKMKRNEIKQKETIAGCAESISII